MCAADVLSTVARCGAMATPPLSAALDSHFDEERSLPLKEEQKLLNKRRSVLTVFLPSFTAFSFV